MRIRILDRYVSREFLRLFFLFALAAPLLFTIFDITDNLDRYLGQGIPPRRVALSYVYQLPLFVLYAFPVASLIATIFTINTMARHSELAAAKAGGLSFYRVIAPLPVLGAALTVAALGISELVPVTTRLRAEILGEKQRFGVARADFVYRTADGRVFSIRRLDEATGQIHGIAMEREGDEPRVPTVHAVAAQATYDPGRGWVLEGGYLRVLLGPGVERTFRFARLQPVGFTERPDQLVGEQKEPEEMGYAELGRFIEILKRSGAKPFELEVHRAQKIAIPVATLIIVLFSAPLAATAQRGGPAYGVGVSLGITILYLMLLKVAGAAGATGALPPLLAAWLPNAAFALAGAALLARVRT